VSVDVFDDPFFSLSKDEKRLFIAGLVNSGDAGFWDPETDVPVIQSREALKAAGYTDE